MKLQKTKFWFTFVELVVVITILAILSTVGFMWYSSYLPSARDTNRLSQMEELAKWIQTYTTRHSSLPIPDNQVEIKAHWNVIAYQWEGGANLLETIWYNKNWLDPKDKVPFSYMVSSNRKAYQLMVMLETTQYNKQAFSLINKASAIDYTKRYPRVFWDNLGILTDTNNNPIETISSIQNDWYLDVVDTTDTYMAHVSDELTVIWSGAILRPIALSMMNWKNYKSCKALYRWEFLSHSNDDYYYIKPEWYSKFKIYCDMTTDWGGWTRYVNIKWNYTYKDARYCVDNLKRVDNDNLFCFYPRALWKLKDYLYISWWNKYQLSWLDQPYNEKPLNHKSKYKHTLFDFVTDISDPSKTSAWFGISYMHNHPSSKWEEEPGWMRADTNEYMNYDDQWQSWPSWSSWESNVNLWEFYVR